MNKEQLIDYINDEFDIDADFPFEDDFETAIFRHKDNKKWFAICMQVSGNKLSIDTNKKLSVLNVKIEPLFRPSLLEKKGIYSAYHMNKTHWVSVVIEQADDEDTKALLDMSFELTRKKTNKKTKK